MAATSKKKSVSQVRAERAAAIVSKLQDIHEKATELQDALSVAVVEAAQKVLSSEQAVEIRQLLDGVSDLSDLYDELEEARSNLEEKFSQTERYQLLEEKVQQLESVKETVDGFDLPMEIGGIEQLGEIAEKLGTLVDEANNAAGELEGVEF